MEPYLKQDMEKLEKVQRRATKVIQGSVAAPAHCSWQGKVRSLFTSGRAVNISIYEQYFMSSDVSNAFYCIKDFNVQNMLNSNQKLHCCQTYKRLLTQAIKLILSHRSNEVE